MPTRAPFTHLHVASGWSMRYGTDTPAVLAARAAELGQHTLALTDRDGLPGAVKHILACKAAEIAPVLGVDLAVAPSGLLDGVRAAGVGLGSGSTGSGPLPRVTVLAHASGPAQRRGPWWQEGHLPRGAGWAALCRLVSAAHAATPATQHAAGAPAAELGPPTPIATLAMIAEHAAAGSPRDPAARDAPAALTVLLGPGSEVGRAVLARRTDLARALLARWYDALPLGSVVVEVVCHDGPPGTSGSLSHAANTLALAREAGLPAVLTHAVRYASPDGARTADLLDAARRRLTLDSPRLARASGAAHLGGTDEMAVLADRVATAAGCPRRGERGGADDLLAATAALADRCRLDPARDLGIGQVHLPEPAVLGLTGSNGTEADAALRERATAAIAIRYPGAREGRLHQVRERLDAELAVIAHLRYPTYFLTVAAVCDMVRDMGVRVAARGSGAGSLVTHLLGISAADPLEHGLLMERFLTHDRPDMPDIDIDVESARRLDVYAAVLDRFGAARVAAVATADTYRVRQAVRDAAAALGLPAAEVDALATAFPHLRARDARAALRDLPELRAAGMTAARLEPLLDLVERLDALPRHLALHPCGVLLSDATLRDRTPVQPSSGGVPFPMSSFDKDDVEVMGLLKLDVLGVRMQSAMAHALAEVERTTGEAIVLDGVARDDEATFRLIRSARTLGCFQIESPGQRELVGRFAPQDFADLVIDISLFRPGPVKSDMVTPFLAGRQGWAPVNVLHESLRDVLAETSGVVVFHEQVIRIIAITAGVSLTRAEGARRAMGSRAGQAEVEAAWRPRALARGYSPADVDRIWDVLAAFASFGFCKAHAVAFALPTYQSAWLKAHHPAAFLAGVLTHDPGMYPKRLILDDARGLGITVLGVDVDRSGEAYRVERVDQVERVGQVERVEVPETPPRWSTHPADPADPTGSAGSDGPAGPFPAGYRLDAGVPDARGWGIRLPLADVAGITDDEVARIVAAAPYASLADLWHRARPSRPVAERLVRVGALDAVHGIGSRPSTVTRRDLLLQVADLERWSGQPSRPSRARQHQQDRAAAPGPRPAPDAQLALDLGPGRGGGSDDVEPSGLPEMTASERVRAELEVLGLDASRHVLSAYEGLLDALAVTRSRDLLRARSRAHVLVAGVKVATQTPPIRSGRRVVFLTLDDATGCVDATFFEDAQRPWAATVFGAWLLLVRGQLRRTGPRGVSLRASGAWELPLVDDAWRSGGVDAVAALLGVDPLTGVDARALAGAAASRASRPVLARPVVGDVGDRLRPAWVGTSRDDGALPGVDAGRSGVPDHPDQRVAAAARVAARTETAAGPVPGEVQEVSHVTGTADGSDSAGADGAGGADAQQRRSGGMGGGAAHRVLLHVSGFRQSPYSDVGTPGGDVRDGARHLADVVPDDRPEQPSDHEVPVDAAPRKLWHASPGSSGR